MLIWQPRVADRDTGDQRGSTCRAVLRGPNFRVIANHMATIGMNPSQIELRGAWGVFWGVAYSGGQGVRSSITYRTHKVPPVTSCRLLLTGFVGVLHGQPANASVDLKSVADSCLNREVRPHITCANR